MTPEEQAIEERWAEVETICRADMKALVIADPPHKSHPAKYPTEVLVELDHVVSAEADRRGKRLRILDPMAGVGRIHRFDEAAHRVVGNELEPEWAIQGLPGLTTVRDATDLPFPADSFNVWATSPSYGNRLADSHDAKDACKKCDGTGVKPETDPPRRCPNCKGDGLSARNTYRAKLGRKPTGGSGSVLQWGPSYRRTHGAMLGEALRVTEGGGLLVVNIANHLRTVGPEGNRRQEEQRVTEWWLNEMMALGCNVVEVRAVRTRKLLQGQNYEARTDGEKILVMRTPEKRQRPPTLMDAPRSRPVETMAPL